MEKLQPLKIPLTGSTLIEASAGTGKTYTITTLFIRLLLEKKCAIDQILVVTFTIAATEELRIKIRERIAEALKCLHNPPGDDAVLAELLSQHEPAMAIELLSDVAARLDELAVYTIDAMCLRVLKDFAFDSKLPMRMDFIADDNYIKTIVMEDYWRRVFGSKDFAFIEQLSQYHSPATLLEVVKPLLQSRGANVYPGVSPDELEVLRRERQKLFFRLASQWESVHREIARILRNEDKVLNGNMYKLPTVENLLGKADSFYEAKSPPAELPKKFELFTASKISRATKKNNSVPAHLFFDLCESYREMHDQYLLHRRAAVLQDARDYIVKNVDRYKRERGLLHFEDLRVRLSDVLTGPDANPLAEKIRQNWPYALIDESQDTDPQQNSIFQSVYRGQPDCGLSYIGDPKQAIYSFRGADVCTYMAAAKEFDRARTLGTNWRSSAGLVNACNALFTFKPNPFIFENNIAYLPVEAAGKADATPLLIDGNAPMPLQFRIRGLEAEQNSPTNAKEHAAENCACEIAAMLNSGVAGQTTIGDQPVCSADIAVLVRSHTESMLIQNALRRRGVRSASNTGKTVFSTDEAKELQAILCALSRPSVDTIRRALVSESIGYTAADIEQLNSSEVQWDNLINRFVQYGEIWLAKSLMAAVQSLFIDLDVIKKVLTYPGGERRVTNLVQLTEILQVNSRQMSSTEELLGWLDRQIANESMEDELLLRLESDQDLVQIVTVHKSKGLEYPIVYLPFGWGIADGSINNANKIISFHERSDFTASVDFGSELGDAHRVLQQEEELSEALRLFYVAVTRAKYLCVVGWGAEGKINRTALGYLLHRDEQQNLSAMKKLELADIVADLTRLKTNAPGCIEFSPMQIDGTSFVGQSSDTNLTKKTFSGSIDRNWSITSYTGLQSGVESGMPDYDFSPQTDPDLPDDEVPTEVSDALGAVARLPAGARTGQLLHEIFETINFTASDTIGGRVADVLERYGSLGAAEDWQPVVETIINNTLNTTLQGESELRLCELAPADRVNELEFFFSINQLDARRLTEVLSGEDQYQATAKGLTFSSMTGLMRGFIDLVARRDGRYFIVDYKSNFLGAYREHYNKDELGKVISGHRYDLQYLIYTVALHRFLQSRLGEHYSYQQHFGGVYYLFVRGMSPGSDCGVWFDRPSADLVNRLDQCFDAEQVGA